MLTVERFVDFVCEWSCSKRLEDRQCEWPAGRSRSSQSTDPAIARTHAGCLSTLLTDANMSERMRRKTGRGFDTPGSLPEIERKKGLNWLVIWKWSRQFMQCADFNHVTAPLNLTQATWQLMINRNQICIRLPYAVCANTSGRAHVTHWPHSISNWFGRSYCTRAIRVKSIKRESCARN